MTCKLQETKSYVAGSKERAWAETGRSPRQRDTMNIARQVLVGVHVGEANCRTVRRGRVGRRSCRGRKATPRRRLRPGLATVRAGGYDPQLGRRGRLYP